MWKESGLYRVFLASPGVSSELKMQREFRSVTRMNSRFAEDISQKLTALAGGVSEGIFFDVPDLGHVSQFGRKILEAVSSIHRGETVSYAELALKAGFPGAARAAGNALVRNPFPLIIPCHRVVRSDGSPGFYQGGTEMKKYLLEAEVD